MFTRGRILITTVVVLLAACAPVAISDPCYGRSDSAECQLYRSQLNATLEATDRNRESAATATSAANQIRATQMESDRLSAEALANAGATATVVAALAQSDIARSNATSTAVANQAALANATSTAVANAIAIDNQRISATATAQHLEQQATLAAQRYENERTIGNLLNVLGDVVRFIAGAALVIGLSIGAWLSGREGWKWLKTKRKQVDIGDGRIMIYDDDRRTSYDLRQQVGAVLDLAQPGRYITAEMLEMLVAIKHMAEKAEIYRRMAERGTDIDDDRSAWEQAQPGVPQLADPAAGQLLLPAGAPDWSRLISSWRPEPNRMLLAYGANGPLYGKLSDLLSTGIVGRQGQGKTTLLRFVYAQCLIVGARALVWDLHDDIVNDLPGAEASTTVEVINESAARLVKELDRRIRGHLHGETPIMVMADEFNSVAIACPGVIESCSRVILEGRKFGVFCMLSAKGLPASLFGGSTIRDSLSSHVAFNTSVRQASQLGFDVEDARVVKDLQPGYALFDGPVDAQVVTFPETTVEDIERLLPASIATSAASGRGNGRGNGSGREAATEAAVEVDAEKVARVRELVAARTPVSRIIRDVWGVSGGNAYQKAAAEYAQIMALLVGS